MSDQVLVIDDEESVRTTLRRALEEEGFSVEDGRVRTGRPSKMAVEEAAPDVAVVDLKLGDSVRSRRPAGSQDPLPGNRHHHDLGVR